MSEAALELSEPQNSQGTGARPGEPGAGQPFEKGRSGNPGGRPKGLARKVREILGDDDGETLGRFWAGIMSGAMVVTIPTIEEDGSIGEKKIVQEFSAADRIAASKLLAERGWGKPPQYAPMEDEDPLDFSEREATALAADLDARIDELAERRRARDAVES